MRAVIQKSGKASVMIDDKVVGQIDKGLVVLIGITQTDTDKDIDFLVDKISNLRLFEDGAKYFDKSVLDTSKQALVISQFTLYANCKNGRRPDFIDAAKGDFAEPLYNQFVEKLRVNGLEVQTGTFGADMKVSLTNEGPITIILDSIDKPNK